MDLSISLLALVIFTAANLLMSLWLNLRGNNTCFEDSNERIRRAYFVSIAPYGKH